MGKTIKPVSRIIKIEAEINRIAGEVFFKRKEFFGLEEGWVPCVDIAERGTDIIVEVEVPGIRKKDINILLHSSRIEINGIKKENPEVGKIKYLRLEREYGPFRRTIFLPSAVVPDEATAFLVNGVLTMVLKKYREREEKKVVLKIQKPED